MQYAIIITFFMELHKKIHHLFYNLLRRLFVALGHDIFDLGEFKPGALAFFLYSFNGISYVSCVYTIWTYDALIGLHSVGPAAICIQVIESVC